MTVSSYEVKTLATFDRTRDLQNLIQISSSEFHGYHVIVMSEETLVAIENIREYIHTAHVRWCIHSTHYITTHSKDIFTTASVFQTTNHVLFFRFHTSHTQWKYSMTSWSWYNQLQYLPKFITSSYRDCYCRKWKLAKTPKSFHTI